MTQPSPDWSQFAPDYEGTEEMHGAVEAIKDAIGIVDAYRRWCGKMDPDEGRTESIMCSCPMLHHEDKNPSVWMNSDKGLWYCAACAIGGDAIDLGAIRFGLDIYSYKSTSFREAITSILVDLGIDTSQFIYSTPDGDPSPERERISADEPIPPGIRQMADTEDIGVDFDLELEHPFDWEACIDEGTFLDYWMQAMTPQRVPNEYLFFLGLQMIGLACGPDVRLRNGFPVTPNINLALLGHTGIGKSLATGAAKEVVRKALPFDVADGASKGIKTLGRPGSGEALYESFSWFPPTSPLEPVSVRGWVEIDELSEFMSATQRQGVILREAVIQISDGRTIHHTLRSNSIEVAKPFCAITTGVQPEALRNVLTDHDITGGFANRFLYVRGTPKERKPWGEQEDLNITGLEVHLQKVHNWARRGRNLTIDSGATAQMDALLGKLEKAKRTHGVLARIDYLALKLLCTMAANRGVDVITVDMVRDLEVITNFLVPGADVVYAEVDQTDQKRLFARIKEIVGWYPTKYSCHPTADEIVKVFSSSDRRRKQFEIYETINLMTRFKVLITVPPTKADLAKCRPGERPPQRFMLQK